MRVGVSEGVGFDSLETPRGYVKAARDETGELFRE
jgi:hypothetical protein